MSDVRSSTDRIPAGPSGQIAVAEWTHRRLADFGIRLPAGNRLQRARRLIEDVNARRVVLSPDSADLASVTEAQWTILEQYIVTRSLGLPGRRLSDEVAHKLETVLSGADTPEADRNQLARSTQFELYVAAFFTMADITLTFAEPDLIFDYLGNPCGLAAKRVNSFRQAPRRADDAADQLRASSLRGVVAVNVDVLLKTVAGDSGPEATLAERLQVLDEVENRMSARDEVIAVMSFGRDCIWDFNGDLPVADLSTSFRFVPFIREAADESRGKEFFDRVIRRVNDRLGTL